MEPWIFAVSHGLGQGAAIATFASLLIGALLLLRDAWRLKRSAPKPEAARAYTDELLREYGEAASRRNGADLVNARIDGDRELYRFLRAVSEELVRRILADRRLCEEDSSVSVSSKNGNTMPSAPSRGS